MKPDFIIVGESRCGSTSLCEYLISHDDVGAPSKDTLKEFKYNNSNIDLSQKELRFFDRNWNKGLEWYINRFPKDKISGDASATYLFSEIAMKRISKYFPEVKIVILLRNPTDRFISHFYHMKSIDSKFDKYQSINDFVNDELYTSHIAERGLYINSLRRCFKLFDRKNLHIVKSEDMFNNEISRFEILNFLGIKNENIKFKHFRSSIKDDILNNTLQKLNMFYEAHNSELYDFLGWNKNEYWQEYR